MFESPPSTRRILIAAFAATALGLGTVSLIANGFSDSVIVRLLQAIAVFGFGAVIIGGVIVLGLVHLAGWKDPESERDFEALVQRSERLAAGEELRQCRPAAHPYPEAD